MIDSEQVPWGKGEKQAGEAVEIEPETICLQGIKGRKADDVPIEEWANDLRDIAGLTPLFWRQPALLIKSRYVLCLPN